MPASSRCAVVGAGIVGLAIARELQARGFEVVVYERSGIGAGASGVQPGGVRQQWGTRVACRLARESVAFWRDIDARLKPRMPLDLRRGGYLFVAQSDAALAQLAENVESQNEEGIPSRIVTPAEAAELVPGLRTDTLAGGSWCAEDATSTGRSRASRRSPKARRAPRGHRFARRARRGRGDRRCRQRDTHAGRAARRRPAGSPRGPPPLPQPADRGAPARAARRRAG